MLYFFFFFFKQKTAYEMRISDWSSDVCSSDLLHRPDLRGESAAGSAGDDNRGYQHAHFAEDADRDDVDRVDLRAEAGELIRTLIRKDDAYQETDRKSVV